MSNKSIHIITKHQLNTNKNWNRQRSSIPIRWTALFVSPTLSLSHTQIAFLRLESSMKHVNESIETIRTHSPAKSVKLTAQTSTSYAKGKTTSANCWWIMWFGIQRRQSYNTIWTSCCFLSENPYSIGYIVSRNKVIPLNHKIDMFKGFESNN